MKRTTRYTLITAMCLTIALSFTTFVGGPAAVAQGEDPAESSSSTLWTCSMHPQIQLPEAGLCPICNMDLIPLESDSGTDLGPRAIRISESAKALARIETTVVRRGFAEAEIRMVGRIAYDETRIAYITARVPGRIDRLYADYTGVTVVEGDHLVSLYSPELLAAQEEMVQAGKSIEALSRSKSKVLRRTAEATLVATREKLRLLGLTDEQLDDIAAHGITSDHLTIYAPIGGVVVEKNVRQGEYVNTGTRIYTIVDLSKLWVLFEAYESDLPWLRYGQRLKFTSTSFPSEVLTATISFIDPVVNRQTRTVGVRAVMDNPDGKLKPDMFVTGIVKSRMDNEGHVLDLNLAGKFIGPMHPEIVSDEPGNCSICGMPLASAESFGYAEQIENDPNAPLLIPATAVLLTGKRAVIYVEVADSDGLIYEGRTIELGPRAGDFYVVKSGLSEGERVVTNGAFKLDAELQIHAKPSMMSPEGSTRAPTHDHSMGTGNSEGHSAMGDMKMDATTEPAREPVSAQTAAERSMMAEFRIALSGVYEAYFQLRAALSTDDLPRAREAAQFLLRERAMSVVTKSSKAESVWNDLQPIIQGRANDIENAESLEDARSAFRILSEAFISLEARVGHAGNDSWYTVHCPMAFGNEGADWLHTKDEVLNPYYGASMLKCGSVTEELDANANGDAK